MARASSSQRRYFTSEVALDTSMPSRAASPPPAAVGVTMWLAALFILVAVWSWRQLAPSVRLVPASILALIAEPQITEPIPQALPVVLGSPDPSLPTVFTPQVDRWSEQIHQWASSYDLDPALVATVMQIESCGHPQARSSAGAIGLFQVMPFHFEAGEDSLNPDVNAARGLAYLARALEISGGRIDLALAGYNGGHGVIGRDASMWPEETRRYVRWGSGIMEEIEAGYASSPTLGAWLDAGGASLCSLADSFPAP